MQLDLMCLSAERVCKASGRVERECSRSLAGTGIGFKMALVSGALLVTCNLMFSLSCFHFIKCTKKSCVKLNTLEPFEDQDLPTNELDESENEEMITVVVQEKKEKWDCESICSKYLIAPPAAKGMKTIQCECGKQMEFSRS